MNSHEEISEAKSAETERINAAVIAAQEAAGVEITDQWWLENVGIGGSAKQILTSFFRAYADLVDAEKVS